MAQERRKLVFVVDDDASIRTLVVKALKAKGYDVIEAEDGLKASEMLGSLTRMPDLLILDVMMPTIDGFSLARLIKHQKELTLSVTRGHRDLTFSVPVGEQQEISEVLWRGSAEQLARLQTWLGQPKLEMKTGEAISLKSHENFHSIQSVV